MITEERLRDAMAACRDAVVPSPGFDDLGRRARRTERQRRVRAVLAAAAAVAVVGATVAVAERGGPTTTASALAKQEFVTSANQICDRAIQQVKAETSRPGVWTLAQIDVAAQRASVIDLAAIAALRALRPPPSDRTTIEAMLTEFDKAVGASLVVIAVQDAVKGDTNSAAFDAAMTTTSKQIATAAQHAYGYRVDRCAALIYPIFARS
jgi:hypothetical protein